MGLCLSACAGGWEKGPGGDGGGGGRWMLVFSSQTGLNESSLRKRISSTLHLKHQRDRGCGDGFIKPGRLWSVTPENGQSANGRRKQQHSNNVDIYNGRQISYPIPPCTPLIPF